MSAFAEEDQMRIPKLQGKKNYQPWAIYLQAAFESQNI